MGQEVKFTGSSSKNKVQVGEVFRITYDINVNSNGFIGPNLSPFNVYNGPNQNFSFNSVNGRITQSLSFYYTLAGTKEGKFTIAPASISVGNAKLKSNSIEIEVVKASKQSAGNNSGNNTSSVNRENSNNQNLFIKAEISKTSAFIGEPLTVAYKVYCRYSMASFSDVKIPSFNGFYSEEIPLNKQNQSSTEIINGVQYITAEIKKTLIIPQKSGKLEIPSLDATLLVKEKIAPRDLWEQMMGGSYRDLEIKIKSTPLSINVLPLPESGKPDNFKGAVGQYKYAIITDEKKLKVGEPFTIAINISGKGNLKLIENQELKLPSEFEIYPPKTGDKITVNMSGMYGSRNFEYLVIPRSSGRYKLSDLSFSFFDPSGRSYQNIKIPEILLDVMPTPGISGNEIRKDKSGEKINPESNILFDEKKNIHFVATNQNAFFLSPIFFLVASIPFILIIIFIIMKRVKKMQSKNQGNLKHREALSFAFKGLKHAEIFLKNTDSISFFNSLSNVVNDYLASKFYLHKNELSKEIISKNLKEKNISEKTLHDFLTLIKSIEMARFTPYSNIQADELMQETKRLIIEIENKLGKS